MIKKVLISPAHHLLDINSQSEHYLAAKIIEGLAKLDSSVEYHVLCGFFVNKEVLPKNVKVYELYRSADIHLNVFVLIYFYAWLLYKSIILSSKNHFDLVWHFLPNGQYSLNLFILLKVYKLFGIRRLMLGRLTAGFHKSKLNKDYIIEIKDGQRTFSSDKFKFLVQFIFQVMGWFTKSYLKNFDTLVFYTQVGKDHYQKILGNFCFKQRAEIIPVGFDPSNFVFQPKKFTEPWQFLFVGALTERKKPLKLIALAKKMSALGISFEIKIIGKGYLSEELATTIQANSLQDTISLIGHVPRNQINDYYQKAHFLLCPSGDEGFTHTLLESWATGTVFIGSDIPVNVELVKEGETGFLFDPESDLELDRIVHLIQSTEATDFQKIANNSLEHSKQFAWPNIIQSYYNLIIPEADNTHK